MSLRRGVLISCISCISRRQVQKDYIVSCQVQRGYFYAHLVKEVEFDKKEGCRKYWISNLKGYVNGWCHIEH